MRIRRDAKLDSSQVEDYRGRSGGGVPGGVPVTLGTGNRAVYTARSARPAAF